MQNQSSGRKHWEKCEQVEQELGSCICYFSIAVKNTKATCSRKSLFGAYSSGGIETHHHLGGSLAAGRHTGRQARMKLEQLLRAYILIHTQEAKKHTGNDTSLLKSQSLPPVTHLLQEGHMS